jgi:hypothetical protein
LAYPRKECDAASYPRTECDAASYSRIEYDAASYPRRRECDCVSSENWMWRSVTFHNNGMLPSVTSQNKAMLSPPLCSFLSMRDQVSHSYKTTGKIIVLCVLIFIFLDMERQDKLLWLEPTFCISYFPVATRTSVKTTTLRVNVQTILNVSSAPFCFFPTYYIYSGGGGGQTL